MRRRREPMSDINVVPYIDVMLVLLVIFMITAPMLTQGVKVDLPQTTSEPIELDKDAEPIVISVDVNGAYFLETERTKGTPMTLDELKADVAKIIASNPKADILVRGDTNVSYGVVVSLMASLQEAGAANVGLITEMP